MTQARIKIPPKERPRNEMVDENILQLPPESVHMTAKAKRKRRRGEVQKYGNRARKHFIQDLVIGASILVKPSVYCRFEVVVVVEKENIVLLHELPSDASESSRRSSFPACTVHD